MKASNISKKVLRGIFEAGQWMKIDILPRHFYSEVPEIQELKRDKSWRRPFSMIGVRGVDLNNQLLFLRECFSAEIKQALWHSNVHSDACAENGHDGYGVVESDVLYAYIRTYKPRNVLQVGCGVSTSIILRAARDAGYHPVVRCVEPYPNEFLLKKHQAGTITLIQTKAQDLSTELIEELPADCFFFVDSTHTLGPAGEVTRIILEALPRLKPGSQVHFHDIYFPYDYDRHLLDSTLFFSHETALLHGYLAQNTSARVLASLSMLHYKAPEELKALVPKYMPATNNEGLEDAPGHFPSSLYLSVE